MRKVYLKIKWWLKLMPQEHYDTEMIGIENEKIVAIEKRVAERKERVMAYLKQQNKSSLVIGGFRATIRKSIRFEFANDVVKLSFFKSLSSKYYYKQLNYAVIADEIKKPEDEMDAVLVKKMEATKPDIITNESISVRRLTPVVQNVKDN